jgi:hypothetical protein
MTLNVPDASAKSVDVLLEAMRSNLDTWARTQKGACYVARDPLAAIELLAEAPSGWRLILSFEGDRPMDTRAIGVPEPYVVESTLRIIVSCNPGLRLINDSQLLKGDTGGRASLLALLSLVRKRILAYRWSTTLVYKGAMTYLGTRPFSIPDFLPLAAFEMTFAFVHSIPEPAAGDLVTITV